MKSYRSLLLLSLIAALPLSLSAQIISSTVAEFNGATTPGDGLNQSLSTTNPAKLTIPTGWDFTSQATISSITSITITLTLQDANAGFGGGPDNFDFGHLFLALDGVNTGIALNGFRGSGLQDTLTIFGTVSPSTSTALMAQFADKMFVGTIITDNANDTVLQPNDIFVGNDTLNATTTLTLNAVPEPATIALIGAGLLLVLGAQVRRFRRNV
jgi:hypothetical protein